MKKKGNILSILLSAVLLFTIVFPLIHSFEHYSKQVFAQKKHSNSKHKTELNYQHSITEKCFGCDQHWSLFTNPECTVFEFLNTKGVFYYSLFHFLSYFSFFEGALFSLRAPPIF